MLRDPNEATTNLPLYLATRLSLYFLLALVVLSPSVSSSAVFWSYSSHKREGRVHCCYRGNTYNACACARRCHDLLYHETCAPIAHLIIRLACTHRRDFGLLQSLSPTRHQSKSHESMSEMRWKFHVYYEAQIRFGSYECTIYERWWENWASYGAWYILGSFFVEGLLCLFQTIKFTYGVQERIARPERSTGGLLFLSCGVTPFCLQIGAHTSSWRKVVGRFVFCAIFFSCTYCHMLLYQCLSITQSKTKEERRKRSCPGCESDSDDLHE